MFGLNWMLRARAPARMTVTRRTSTTVGPVGDGRPLVVHHRFRDDVRSGASLGDLEIGRRHRRRTILARSAIFPITSAAAAPTATPATAATRLVFSRFGCWRRAFGDTRLIAPRGAGAIGRHFGAAWQIDLELPVLELRDRQQPLARGILAEFRELRV